MNKIPIVRILEFNNVRGPINTVVYGIPTSILSPEQMKTLLAADHRMYSDETRELARDGLCDRDPVHEAMRVVQEVRSHIISLSKPADWEAVEVVETITLAYLIENRYLNCICLEHI